MNDVQIVKILYKYHGQDSHAQYTGNCNASIRYYNASYDGDHPLRCGVVKGIDPGDREYMQFYLTNDDNNASAEDYESSTYSSTFTYNGESSVITNESDYRAYQLVQTNAPVWKTIYTPPVSFIISDGTYINNTEFYDSVTGDILGYAFKDGKFYDTPFDDDDPYTDSTADDDGGNGSPDWSSDPISERALPDDFYGNSGLVQIFTPTTAELNAFASYIWSDNGLDLNDFKKIVNNPFDLVLGLNYMPFRVSIAGQRGVNVGNILSADTGLTMSYPTQENYIHSFGSLSIKEDENAFIDYAPFSRVSIHLPFIGTQAIDIDLIRRNSKYNDTTIELKYKYNIVNGTVVAYLKTANQKILYEWAGNVATPVPVASNDYTQTIAGLMSMASSAVSGAVTGAAIGSAVPGIGTAVGAIAGGVKGVASGGIDQVAALKPSITTTGSVGSSAAVLTSSNDAFLIIEQPPLSIANNHRHYKGYPRNVSGYVKNSYGYNEIAACRMSCELATGEELAEISEIMQSGYIYGTVSKKNKNKGTVTPKPTVDPGNSGFTVGLFQTSSSNIRIDKKCTLIEDYTTCTVKEDTSVITPTIILDADNTKAIKANYCYIPAYKRFYFIKDKRCLRGNLWEFDLACDVLMSFRDDIIEHTVIFKKSEAHWNLYLNDGSLQVDSRTRIKIKKFPNSLTNGGSYVLLLAGTQ